MIVHCILEPCSSLDQCQDVLPWQGTMTAKCKLQREQQGISVCARVCVHVFTNKLHALFCASRLVKVHQTPPQ